MTMMERGDLVRVKRPSAHVRFGVVLATRVKHVANPGPAQPSVYNQALVRYEDHSKAWTNTRYVFKDDGS